MAARSLISRLGRSDARLRRPTEVATFAAGCFWGVEADFRELDGVIDPNAGYTGGPAPNPSGGLRWRHRPRGGRPGDLDPARVSYEELLATFWQIHDPTQVGHQGFDIGQQYRSAVFAHDSRQTGLALASRGSEQRFWSRTIATEVLPAGPFYMAEPYHQRLYEREGGSAPGRYARSDLKSWLALADASHRNGVVRESRDSRRQ